jgi:large subunit ribosomal protein L21
VLESPFP